jgi:hypothetical protein
MLNSRRWFHRFGIVVAVALLMILTVDAQRRRFRFVAPSPGATVPYDGRFTVVRLWYQHYAGWSYDYPDMERNVTLDPTNGAFKFGVNYIIYGLTH